MNYKMFRHLIAASIYSVAIVVYVIFRENNYFNPNKEYLLQSVRHLAHFGYLDMGNYMFIS